MGKLNGYFWSAALASYFIGALVFTGFLIYEVGDIALQQVPDGGPEFIVLIPGNG